MTTRQSASPELLAMFTDRWSPRSFSPEPVSDEQLAAVFEAARWTPSWLNNQPWIYVYETDGPARQAILDTFMDFNRGWASAAPVAGLVLARTELEGFMGRTRDFDTGAATMAMILQATALGLSAHLLGGIELEPAYEVTGADPTTTDILCGFVLGHRGDASNLDESLKAKEQPSDRKPVGEFTFRGGRLPDGFGA